MATITDVAERAGVSVKTVSRVMNNYEHVSHKTRQKVEAAMAELNYREIRIIQRSYWRTGDAVTRRRFIYTFQIHKRGRKVNVPQIFLQSCTHVPKRRSDAKLARHTRQARGYS